MSWIRSRDRRTAQRLAVVDGYRFTAGVRHRFAVEHGDLDAAGVALVEDAIRQWFRLTARRPRARLSMPSVAVDELWNAMVLDARDYAQFCDKAFGHFLAHTPESALTATAVAAHRTGHLADTLRLAQQDEGCRPEMLPLIFRVDRQLDIKAGRHYLADCGGRGECYEVPGALCLRHVAGMENPKRWRPDRRGGGPPADGLITGGSGIGCGGTGCGGGGCGGGS
ncbi:hypothetical protein AB0J83_25680 [Actinoplanes sp. NPDC049596]|uniref:hypothetical protein n=1 Tax=unclassified Actinoplanes TaxID=2626549 RepID=UPI0034262471